jgi:hypothetical protein
MIEKHQEKMPDLIDLYEAELHNVPKSDPLPKVELCKTFEEKCKVLEEHDEDESGLPKFVKSYEAELHNVFSVEQLRRMQRDLTGEEPIETNFDVD